MAQLSRSQVEQKLENIWPIALLHNRAPKGHEMFPPDAQHGRISRNFFTRVLLRSSL